MPAVVESFTGHLKPVFVFPTNDGRWRKIIPAPSANVIDGHFHKFSFCGVEVRSGESFGLTMSIHAGDASTQSEDGKTMDILKITIENGRLLAAEKVEANGIVIE